MTNLTGTVVCDVMQGCYPPVNIAQACEVGGKSLFKVRYAVECY